MHQLALDLIAAPAPSLDNFVVGGNQDVLHALRLALTAPAVSSVYVWGPRGSGKSHLAQAFAAAAQCEVLSPNSSLEAFEISPARVAIDDCDALDPARQEAAFHLFNRVRDSGGFVLTCGAATVLNLQLREDLRTRLGWGLIYQLHPLTDEDKLTALRHTARERGVKLSDDLLPYILTHLDRDMSRLGNLLDALDRYALQQKRALTLPLLKEWLHESHDL